jgi:pseudaminic acid biosynthesis-associated methylase
MNKFKTEQEQFWADNFGDEYTSRNQNSNLVANNTALFTKILAHTSQINSIIEFGANMGLNLIALRQLLPNCELSAIEINQKAVIGLNEINNITIYNMSILDFSSDRLYDFVLTKGVLIHMDPDKLPIVYDLLYKTTGRFICIAEYYNPKPMEVNYRGHSNKLFKRDFAGEILNRFTDLKLIDYGFVYHRDYTFPQDDITWFLLGKI